jgi:alpha-galactosidase
VVVVASDGSVQRTVDDAPGGLAGALGRWADGYAVAAGVGPLRPPPTLWCSWYCYRTEVTERDMLENLAAIRRLRLPVDVLQLDDGYQAELGDWLALSGRFRSLADLVGRIRDQGLRAGIWTAPFLVSGYSRLYAEHPDWLVGGAAAGHNWGQDLLALDVTHPDAADYLRRVFSTLRQLGIDFFKIDFVYAGALDGGRHQDVPPVEAYRRGVRLIRDAVGPDAYLLGCGAPILPSVGLVDAMRVGPDIGPAFDPPDGDLARPSQRSAALSVAGRAWQHGRFWANDPDCLLAGPEVERRQDWAALVERYGGLRGSSDRLDRLDGWGLEATRRLLATVPPPRPFA